MQRDKRERERERERERGGGRERKGGSDRMHSLGGAKLLFPLQIVQDTSLARGQRITRRRLRVRGG